MNLPRSFAAAMLAALFPVLPASAQSILRVLEGDAPGDLFGHRVAAVGDIDGDGFTDLAVGIPGSSVAGEKAGEMRVYSGRTGSLLLVAYGQNPGDYFGGSLAGIGDVDGDGVPDILVGATTDQHFDLPYGGQYVRVISGADGAVIRHQTTPNLNTFRFGFSVAAAGDLDGDGVPDYIVGAPDFEPECPWAWWCNGAAFVYSGATGMTIHAFTSGSQELTKGYDVDGGHDIDGDGVPDLLVGDPKYFGEADFRGRINLHSGSTGELLHQWNLDSSWPNNPNSLGRLARFVGDVDGDGVSDVLAAYEIPVLGGRRLSVFSGATKEELYILNLGSEATQPIYISGAAVGDLTGNGLADLLLGNVQQGRVDVRAGVDGKLLFRHQRPVSHRLGTWVAGLGDLTGDGFPEFAAGAPQGTAEGYVGPGYVVIYHGFQDCNGDGIQDLAQMADGSLSDCLGSGRPDVCEIAEGLVPDCNGNGVPDACDLASGFSLDCNENGIPDECDIASGTSNDFDGDGVPDECQCDWSKYCVAAPNTAGPGALISLEGSLSVTLNQLVLTVTGGPPGQPGIFFFGLNAIQSPFGEGWLCVSGDQKRLNPPVFLSAAGAGQYLVDFTDPSSPASQLQPGDERRFQFWYRDPQLAGFGFNLSDALRLVLCP